MKGKSALVLEGEFHLGKRVLGRQSALFLRGFTCPKASANCLRNCAQIKKKCAKDNFRNALVFLESASCHGKSAHFEARWF